jgi:hypothetical protein
LDIASNNAGIAGPTHLVEDYPAEQFDRAVADIGCGNGGYLAELARCGLRGT